MGQVMASRLLGGQFDLMVYNRSEHKVRELAERGARVASSIAQACAHGGPVITMLAHDQALHAVAHGAGGIIESLPPGGIHVVMGTHQVETIRALAEAHR